MDDRLRDLEIRMGAVAQRVEDHEGDLTRFANIVTELHEVRWTLGKINEDFGQDIKSAHEAIRDLTGRLEEEHRQRVEGQADRKREIEEAREERNLEIARIEKDRETEYQEMRDRDQQRRSENRKMMLTLLGVFVTSAGAVIVQILGGGS